MNLTFFYSILYDCFADITCRFKPNVWSVGPKKTGFSVPEKGFLTTIRMATGDSPW